MARRETKRGSKRAAELAAFQAQLKAGEPLPIGDLYAVRLADGRYGACRVIGPWAPAGLGYHPHVRGVIVTTYIGDAPPALDDPALRQILILTHHHFGPKFGGRKCVTLLLGPVPQGVVRIGRMEPTAAEKKLEFYHAGDWDWVASQVLAQWRWDHDRAAVQAEHDARQRQHDALMAEHARIVAARPKLTYASFRRRAIFEDWPAAHSRTIVAAARKIMRGTATKLEALGPKPSRRKACAILRDCILAFNTLDDANDHWITTIEREDICEVFYQLAHLAGFDDEPELADEWREF